MKKNRLGAKASIILLAIGFLIACSNSDKMQPPLKQGIYEIYHQKALNVLDINAGIKVLETGFSWVEGPVWSDTHQFLLFSDIPNHKVFKYQVGKGVSEYLSDSGYSNGLLIDHQDQLILMQSRRRHVVKMNADLLTPEANYQTLSADYRGKKLNSPNDVTLHDNGTLYFTDPPYGLPKQLDDPKKELLFQGVYALTSGGFLNLQDDNLKYPNGITLSNDQRHLYVAVSDPNHPAWYQYDVKPDGQLTNKKLFYQTQPVLDAAQGLPDGLKMHQSGVIFATGPEGIWLFDAEATLLAKIKLPSIAANLAFNTEQSRLYITAHQQLLALDLKL
ncbi:SMP-30/gluconolactonase/LRE family protein [Catenovulum adriaticum]|uniref:SMP-30/gluconolactonase/LRE family protein n=1 Tax=Catenovulum adriaticum TaxID=2984846 RepID=A0ABY7ART7_9ALTE|nr:SMP-30/gluconolactonase/LRE family protein [Catenovulum sp. TS8]WAJ72243.1 SMP-30/gluconolactonase/LRE family protein [Catenovulum sp. TS8]